MPTIATFVTGYALWWVDILLCTKLRSWRAQMGLPWAFFLELHGWSGSPPLKSFLEIPTHKEATTMLICDSFKRWHVLTAVGVYCYIDLVEELRDRWLGYNDEDRAAIRGRKDI